MSTVFISGSMSIKSLDDFVVLYIKDFIWDKFNILVGDANGIDLQVQQLLYDEKYENVNIYCSGNKCRNNIGGWKVINVKADDSINGRDFYTKKDIAMTKRCDFGFVIWDSKSEGTKNNIERLRTSKKSVWLFYQPTRKFVILDKNGKIYDRF